jgi:hypothetical protein
MNPKDLNLNYVGFPMETVNNPEPEPKPKPKFKKGDYLFGNDGENPEFDGTVRDIGDWTDEPQYALIRNETDWHSGEIQWYNEKDVHTLSLLDRVRRIEHFLEID